MVLVSRPILPRRILMCYEDTLEKLVFRFGGNLRAICYILRSGASVKLFILMIGCLFALAPHFNLPLKPKVIKTAGGQRLLNPLQLNNLAQILPGITFCILCYYLFI